MTTPASGPSLTKAQLDELRAELEKELKRLERSMKVTEAASKPVRLDQASVGRLSRMNELQNQQMSAGLHEREEIRHLAIIDALSRMEKGTFGRCSKCGADIAYGRLMVFPEARTCAACGSG